MSDLGDGGEEEEEEEEVGRETDEHADFESRIQSLQSEVDTLSARLQEEQQRSLPLTQSSLRRHNTEPQPAAPSPEMRVLGQVASLMNSQLQRQQREEERVARGKREELVRRLEEVEREGCTVGNHVEQLHTSLKKLVMHTSLYDKVLHLYLGSYSKFLECVSFSKRPVVK